MYKYTFERETPIMVCEEYGKNDGCPFCIINPEDYGVVYCGHPEIKKSKIAGDGSIMDHNCDYVFSQPEWCPFKKEE